MAPTQSHPTSRVGFMNAPVVGDMRNMTQDSTIQLIEGHLQVPENPIIHYIEGDGIGIDITPVMIKVVDQAVSKAYGGSREIQWSEVLAGQKAFDTTGEWLPEETLEAMRSGLVSIKGPLTTQVGGGIRSLNVALRQKLDLFACVRPVRWFDGTPSPVRDPGAVDMIIFRENSEDVYAGKQWEAGTPEVQKVIRFLQDEMGVEKIRFPETSGIGIKPISSEGTSRIVRAAIRYAIENDKDSVTLVHKGNIMKFTEGGFKQWGYEIAEKDYSDKVFTWSQYDKIAESDGIETANKVQNEAVSQGKIIINELELSSFQGDGITYRIVKEGPEIQLLDIDNWFPTKYNKFDPWWLRSDTATYDEELDKGIYTGHFSWKENTIPVDKKHEDHAKIFEFNAKVLDGGKGKDK